MAITFSDIVREGYCLYRQWRCRVRTDSRTSANYQQRAPELSCLHVLLLRSGRRPSLTTVNTQQPPTPHVHVRAVWTRERKSLFTLWGLSAANFITGLWGRPRTPVLFMRVLDHHTNSHRRHRPDSRHTRTPEMPAICTISLTPARAIDTMLSVRMPQRLQPPCTAERQLAQSRARRYQSSLSSVLDTLTRRGPHCTLHSTATSRCSSAAAPHPPPPPCLLLLRTTSSSSLSPPPPRHHCHVITLDEPWPPSYLIRRALIPLSL